MVPVRQWPLVAAANAAAPRRPPLPLVTVGIELETDTSDTKYFMLTASGDVLLFLKTGTHTHTHTHTHHIKWGDIIIITTSARAEPRFEFRQRRTCRPPSRIKEKAIYKKPACDHP